MLKLAFATGITAEWLIGPAAHSFMTLGLASLRALMFTALAWVVLEAVGAAFKAADSLDG